MADGLRRCTACRRRSSVTAGTIFAGTRTPLTLWFAACWYVVNQKNGVSALGLQRVLGLGSYETAWAWLHKLRRAMVRPGRDLLTDAVEVDETYVGGVRPGKRGRGAHGKAIVVIAVEDRGKAAGRVRMRRVGDVRKATLTDFVLDTVARGAEVHTDAWEGYNDIGTHRFSHVVTNLSTSGDPAHVVLPHVHRVASLLKRWLLGTHQGAVTVDQLDYYLDEFTFRFNRRRSRHRGLLFYRLLEQAVQTDPHPLNTLLKGARDANQPKPSNPAESGQGTG
jgi:transposase-like protein